jgi:hypothetical protein
MNAAVSPNLRSLEALRAQIAAQNEISCLLREQLHDLRINRDAWRTHAEAAQHILVDGRPRRRGPDSKIGRVDALFKRCLLPILFAVVLLTPSNLIPIGQENLEAVFRCLLPAFDQLAVPAEKTGISTLGFVTPAYTPEDRDYLIRTIAFEASGEPDDGKAAVAHVILTR